MKCPNCGANIPDDKLICENCGAELEIVADLEYDIDKEMDKTLKDIARNEFEEFDMDFDDDPNIFSLISGGKKSGKAFYISIAVVLVFVIIAAVILGKKLSSKNTYEYQIEMAKQEVAENDLLSAIGYLEEANKIKPDAQLLFTIADYYYTLERDNDAIFTLLDIAHGDFKQTDVESAYRKVISVYSENQSYEKIAEVLADCDNSVVLSAYEDYLVFEPEFSLQEGTYEEACTVSISSKGNGKIYYTIDSSVPTTASNLYEKPVLLEMGSYVVTAVYVNKYGISGKPVSKKYLIDVAFEFEPKILTESGEYTEASLIEAEVAPLYMLYYTMDGEDPDKTSKRYVSPIPMPEGEHTFKFICYTPDGTPSTIVERTYSLSIQVVYGPAEAVAHLGDVLREKGILRPDSDTKEGISGKFLYIYSAIYPIPDRGTFYFVVEYHEDDAGNVTNTNNTYAVDANDLSVYKVTSTGTGEYILIDF